MYLTKIGNTTDETISKVDFEMVVHDLLMISVINNVNSESRVPSYWRLVGSGEYPPLEVGINTQTKTIQNMTVFLDSSCFKDYTLPNVNITLGEVMLETDVFHKTNDYVDVVGQYVVSVENDNLICIFDDKYNIKERFKNGRMELLLSDKDELCGFSICSLTEHEMKCILSLKH